jgi:hypothetical protein
MQNFITLEPLVSGPAIGQDVTAPVTYMQAGSRGIREHIEAIVFGSWILVPRFMQLAGNPVLTPLRLDLSRVVAFIGHDPMIIAYRSDAILYAAGSFFEGS